MRTSKHKATYALLIEILLCDRARFNTHLMPTEEEKPRTVNSKQASESSSCNSLSLSLSYFLSSANPACFPSQHLVDELLLVGAQRVPGACPAQVCCGGLLGLVQILAHRFLVHVLAHAFPDLVEASLRVLFVEMLW